MTRAVFLDRDGIINDTVFRDGVPASPRTLEEFRYASGVAAALQQLSSAGFRLFVVSNQPDVARGLLTAEVLARIGDRIRQDLPIDAVVVCPHDEADACACRKPSPGMILEIAEREHLALSRSYMIGDMWKDVEAGRRAGCLTILIQRPYSGDAKADYIASTLAEAAQMILSNEQAHVG